MKMIKYSLISLVSLIATFLISPSLTYTADIEESLSGSLANIRPYGGHFVSVLDNGYVYDYRYNANGTSLHYKMIAGGQDSATVKPVIIMTKPGIFLVSWYRYQHNETVTQVINFNNFKTDNIYSYDLAPQRHHIEYHAGIISPIP